MNLNYSFVIPVFNRPDEIRELLESMCRLDFKGSFEIVIIEDGSTVTCEEVVQSYREKLEMNYFYKKNSGPGPSRNFGMEKAKGDYFIILDSDVLLPPQYLQKVDQYLGKSYCDCFGGPDAAHESFSKVQKAINYAMTSILTTGGIRGKKTAVDHFQPRSFNMGISRKAFSASGGFGNIHPGEDPDLSLRLNKLGFRTCLFAKAFVYHKRRINWNKFYRQVHNFGLVRPILNRWHPASAKITYWFPSIFVSGFIISVLFLGAGIWTFFCLYLVYFFVILVDASVKNRSFGIGLLAVLAVGIQFFGYGYGFLKSVWQLEILKNKPETTFPKLFF